MNRIVLGCIEGMMTMAAECRCDLEELADMLADCPPSQRTTRLYLAVAITLALIDFAEEQALTDEQAVNN